MPIPVVVVAQLSGEATAVQREKSNVLLSSRIGALLAVGYGLLRWRIGSAEEVAGRRGLVGDGRGMPCQVSFRTAMALVMESTT